MEDLCKPPLAVSVEEPLPNANATANANANGKGSGGGGGGGGGGGQMHSKTIQLPKEEELLGSVTTHNCPGTRASARVIQKMKQDQTRPMTPPPSEREVSKKEEKAAQKTPSQLKTGSGKTTWTNVERNCFFDALNEFGKDFEAVANCINAKLKRRNASSDYSFKTKDQVRQHYYQTYHKICKYVRYSEELKKPAQELYTLINYGEMRRKLQFLTEKHFMKLKQLVYQGQITVRCKGKNIRIKTPSCKALRRLNQLDDSLEDIRLPSKVEVLVTPANMEAFGRVQSLAQNPRGRIIVPLHKKLIGLIKTFEFKWRSADQRLHEEKAVFTTAAAAAANNNNEPEPPPTTTTAASLDPSLCFQPRPGVAIHRPLLSITAYLSSINICLAAYEERMGFKVRSETLGSQPFIPSAASKRPRTESGSEKRSPEAKKPKSGASPPLEKSLDDALPLEGNLLKLESSSGDELGEEIHEFLGDIVEATVQTVQTALAPVPADDQQPETLTDPAAPTVASEPAPPAPATPAAGPPAARSKRKEAKEAAAAATARNFKPLLSDEILKRIRKGWTEANAADITIGDLYVVFGQDSKLELEYFWCETESSSVAVAASSSSSSSSSVATQTGNSQASSVSSNSNSSSSSVVTAASLPYNPNDCDSVERVKAVTTSSVGNKLKHLLLVANLSERVRKRQCTCGHTCDRKRDLMSKAQQLAEAAAAGGVMEGTFRTPMLPVRRPIANIIDPVRQLSALTRQKMSRQVLVQRRLLPPASMGGRPYDLLSVRQLHSGLFEPIERLGDGGGSASGVGSSASDASGSVVMPPQYHQQQVHPQTMQQLLDEGSAQGGARDMPNLDFCVATSTTGVGSGGGGGGSSSLAEAVQDESTTQNFFHGSVSPMHLLRDSTSNARWLEDNINDFSLTSLLGHLDEIDATRDILDPSSSMSVISESSVDFRHKFQEIAALLQQQEKD
ncbi:protein cramped [Drosophila gunungcola]|uniref:SANT domain-containing protein n=1 Tax=Drosophila gunungcola TaxID=103775 RepID=A0A9P9YFL0_9MUSC|nr:protein cramped [Drosophila gunungcola]KAI8036055.1 hypothetical protein M5D96_011149 [Drosophila gunungcola]